MNIKRWLKLLYAAAIVAIFALGTSAQTRVNQIYRPCAGSTTPASVRISTAGGISLTPCSGQTITFGDLGFTLGSIPFVNANGTFVQNNSRFFWDNTNFRLGVGLASPSYGVDISTPSSNAQLRFGRSVDNVGEAVFFANSGGVVLGNSTGAAIISYLQNGPTTLNYPTSIGGMGDAASVRLVLPLAASQSANAFETRSSANALLGGFDAVGRVFGASGGAVASAAAIVPTGNVFHVTGTTNITSITSTAVNAGTCISIIFDAALTFTDGNNLKLNGNFVTTADDTISLCFDGTNWYEMARAVN